MAALMHRPLHQPASYTPLSLAENLASNRRDDRNRHPAIVAAHPAPPCPQA